MKVRIKMCGTTRVEDAEAAVALGVDALGFIFAVKSPRYVAPDQAAALIDNLPPFIARVGVFVDSTLELVKDVVTAAGLTQVQLHGSESADYCRELKNWNRSLTVCKAFRVGRGTGKPDLPSYSGVVDCLLFDTYVRGMEGGTGQTFDWDVIARLRSDQPVILAGGLTPDNVGEAIKKTTPYAVDVNSGVEDSPGVKNHEMLARLVACVRRAETELGG
jgi:phosphoribosylanthranilate isomerase